MVLEHVCQVKKDLQESCANDATPFRYLIEEVASMKGAIRDKISQMLGETPALLQAGDYGTCQRSRYYWGLSSLEIRPDPSYELQPLGKSIEGVSILRWRGEASPESWTADPGWEWPGASASTSKSPPVEDADWQASYSGGRFKTLTTCFRRPPDRGNKNGKWAMYQFKRDGGMFPPFTLQS